MTLDVLRRWFTLLHLLRNVSQTQVVPDVDGPEIVSKTTKQASFGVTLVLPTLARESTFQNMIVLHFCYWCFVVLWQGLRLSVVLRPTWRRHFYVFTVYFFREGLLFLKGEKIVLVSGRKCQNKGWKRDGKGPKTKKSIFFTTRVLVQWIHYTSEGTVYV